jgi:hypothetical protein
LIPVAEQPFVLVQEERTGELSSNATRFGNDKSESNARVNFKQFSMVLKRVARSQNHPIQIELPNPSRSFVGMESIRDDYAGQSLRSE